jgi:release factor glutamine methyltransferase
MEISPARDSRFLFRIMASLRNLIKRIANPILKTGLKFYYRKPRTYKYKGINVIVHPDVFPPHLTFSTKILLDFIDTLDLKQKNVLELGCGSGIISLFANKKGANVIASDINETALEYLQKASVKNNLPIKCIHSNLFENLAKFSFDYIIINPPYYPKQPNNIKEQAWFCGEKFEYFERLFQQLSKYLSQNNSTYMILSQDCNFEIITSIAKKNQLNLSIIEKRNIWNESNYIYGIEKII